MAKCILTICLFLIVEFNTVIGDCRIPGSLYRGTKNYTKSGLPCQQWDQQTPHRHDYDVYSLATDNFCRNFDKEVPWCFTTNPDVRLEDCKVEICDSPCYSAEVILSAMVDSVVECYPGENPDCGDIEKYVLCLLREISTKHSVECTDERATAILIKKHSEILSQMQSVQVDRTRCFPSPCTRKENIIATENEECLEQYSNKLLLAKSAYTFCRYMTKLMRCVISLLAERNNATCNHKDQIKIVNEIENYIAQILPGSLNGYDLSLCVFSEFSSPKDPVTTTPSIEVDSTENLTTVYIIGGVVCLVFLVLIILLFICLLRKRKRQHSCDNSSQRGIQLRYVPARLPSIPSTKDRGSGIYDYIKPDDDEHKYETVQSESHINKQEAWQPKRKDIQDSSVNLISSTNPQEVPSYIVIIDNNKTDYLNEEKSLLLQQEGNRGDNNIQKATLKMNSERIKEENIDNYHKLESMKIYRLLYYLVIKMMNLGIKTIQKGKVQIPMKTATP